MEWIPRFIEISSRSDRVEVTIVVDDDVSLTQDLGEIVGRCSRIVLVENCSEAVETEYVFTAWTLEGEIGVS